MARCKNPAFLYYPKDWRADAVFTCSLAARGLWHEMLNMMHAAERYGYLSMNSLPIPDESISRYCGCTLQEYQTLLTELERAGVPRHSSNGTIYSKRMVEDQKERNDWRKRKQNQRVRDSKRDVTPMSQRLPSSSPFPIKEKEGNTNTAALPPEIVPIHLWVSFVEMRRKAKKPLSDYAGELIRRKLQRLKDSGEDPIAVLEQSIVNNWADVFTLKRREFHGKTTTSDAVQSFLRNARQIKPN